MLLYYAIAGIVLGERCEWGEAAPAL